METIGHHTCGKAGGVDEVLKEGPYIALHDPVNPNKDLQKHQYLGTGYYFWDNDLKSARWWGKENYWKRQKEGYYILSNKISLAEGVILDLMGRRTDQEIFNRLVRKAKGYGYGSSRLFSGWTIASFIEFYKRLHRDKLRGDIFAFLGIRVQDMPAEEWIKNFKVYLTPTKDKYVYFRMRYMICLFEKSPQVLIGQNKLVYESV